MAVFKLEKKFLGSVLRLFHMQRANRRDEADLAQLLTKSLGEIGHFINGVDALLINPSQDLDTSITFFPKGLEEFIEVGRAQILKVDLF